MASMDQYMTTRGKRLLQELWPHIAQAAIFKARVTAMTQISDRVWQYSLKPLPVDEAAGELPEIPGVKSHLEVEAGVGGTVAIALLYGRWEPVIIDEVIP